MKIIEAMKKVKENKDKIGDLHNKIMQHCANLSYETPVYSDTKEKISSWAQSCTDLTQENISLLTRISKTNLNTEVEIDICGNIVKRSIAHWIWRRREYADTDKRTYLAMTDRNLQNGTVNSSTGVPVDVKVERHYDPEIRDKKIEEYSSEINRIDSSLEVANAITDLLE